MLFCFVSFHFAETKVYDRDINVKDDHDDNYHLYYGYTMFKYLQILHNLKSIVHCNFATYCTVLFVYVCLTINNCNVTIAAKNCNGAFECFGEIINETEEVIIDCFGRGSCAQGMIRNNIIGDGTSGKIRCYGARSCQSISLLDGNGEEPAGMRGYLSGAWTETLIASTVNCYGEASCYNIVNTTSDVIECFGFRSCLGLQGINNDNVYGYGVLSLENSILHNPGNVELYGFYSGYNSTIYCDYNTTCSIDCHSNGCDNLNLVCGSMNDWTDCDNINSINSMYDVSCDETQGIICPNGWGNDSINITGNNMYNNNTNYSNSYELLEIILDKFNYTSNMNSESNVTYAKNTYFSECTNPTISDFQCENNKGCMDLSSPITDRNNICCTGHRGCEELTIGSFSNLFCDGSQSCNEITATGTMNMSDVYFRSCDDQSSSLSNFKSMIISGYQAMKDSTIKNGTNIACFGYESAKKTNITGVSNIYAGGYHASQSQMQIFSGGIGEMNVYFLGYESSDDIDIICNNNDVCTIYCLTDDACNYKKYRSENWNCDDNENCTILVLPTDNTPMPTSIPTKNPTLPTSLPTDNPSNQPTSPSTPPSSVPTASTSKFITKFISKYITN